MPMRVGFAQFRKQMLEKELENIQEVLPMLGVEKVILTGEVAAGEYTPESRIELIVVPRHRPAVWQAFRLLLLPPGQFGRDRHPGLHGRRSSRT